jgi:hexosaminidase
LTQIGAWRKINIKNNEASVSPRPEVHGGFFSQAEIKEIVQYAADRFIEVIPEIEMPGHSQAAISAYPEISCTGGPFQVANTWGVFRDVYCPGKEKTFEFLENILKEVMNLFPSTYIHTGGDECPKDRWNLCPDCQAKIKKEGLKDSHALQVYFTNRMSKFLQEHGKRLMGWNEILDDNLAPNAIGHFWMGSPDLIVKHLRKGRDIVVSRSTHIYLDHPYTHSSLKKAYSFEPIPEGVEPEFQSHVLGIEAPLWTEHVPSLQRAYWQTFPRLTAVAETGWTPKDQKDYQDFFSRWQSFKQHLANLGICYASDRESNPGLMNLFKH